jgi:type III pantothenate kinase
MTHSSRSWLALAIGNSRLHWASFINDTLHQVWQTEHLTATAIVQLIDQQFDFAQCRLGSVQLPPDLAACPELWITSVVPQQTQMWQCYSDLHWITLAQVPLQEMYPTFGSDRAVALWGAIVTHGSPVLVIDGGTALTFTGAAGDRLVGGAILPGLQLQLQSLGQSTAALPQLQAEELTALPPRWALDTPNAIYSGVVHSAIAGVNDFMQAWWQQFPQSAIIFTGGDGEFLYHGVKPDCEFAELLHYDRDLIFRGMRSLRSNSTDFSPPQP